jgi:hypothetical protein
MHLVNKRDAAWNDSIQKVRTPKSSPSDGLDRPARVKYIVIKCTKVCNTMIISSYVVMEMDARLDDAKAVAPMLVTVDIRHTFRIVLSSSTYKQFTIKMEMRDSSIYNND